VGAVAAVTAPSQTRSSSSCVNECAVAPQIIAAPQITMATPRIQVRRARSASTPNGSENTAPTAEVTATSSPMSVLPIPSACRSCTAAAPTVDASALDSASTLPSMSTIRVRAGPPDATTSRRLAACPLRRTTRYAGPNTRDRPAGAGSSVLCNGPRSPGSAERRRPALRRSV
jgi:hypothetical protein